MNPFKTVPEPVRLGARAHDPPNPAFVDPAPSRDKPRRRPDRGAVPSLITATAVPTSFIDLRVCPAIRRLCSCSEELEAPRSLRQKTSTGSSEADRNGFLVVFPEPVATVTDQPADRHNNITFWEMKGSRTHHLAPGALPVDDDGYLMAVLHEVLRRDHADRGASFLRGVFERIGGSPVARIPSFTRNPRSRCRRNAAHGSAGETRSSSSHPLYTRGQGRTVLRL